MTTINEIKELSESILLGLDLDDISLMEMEMNEGIIDVLRDKASKILDQLTDVLGKTKDIDLRHFDELSKQQQVEIKEKIEDAFTLLFDLNKAQLEKGSNILKGSYKINPNGKISSTIEHTDKQYSYPELIKKASNFKLSVISHAFFNNDKFKTSPGVWTLPVYRYFDSEKEAPLLILQGSVSDNADTKYKGQPFMYKEHQINIYKDDLNNFDEMGFYFIPSKESVMVYDKDKFKEKTLTQMNQQNKVDSKKENKNYKEEEVLQDLNNLRIYDFMHKYPHESLETTLSSDGHANFVPSNHGTFLKVNNYLVFNKLNSLKFNNIYKNIFDFKGFNEKDHDNLLKFEEYKIEKLPIIKPTKDGKHYEIKQKGIVAKKLIPVMSTVSSEKKKI